MDKKKNWLWEAATDLFGMVIRRPEEEYRDQLPAFAPKHTDDGATVVAATGGFYGTYVDLDGSVRTEAELVTKYRDMSLHPEVDAAIEDISNEVIVTEDGEKTVQIILDDVPNLPPAVAKAIEAEFETVLRLLEFNTKSYDVFRRWYIDGRLYYEVIVDPQNTMMGIQEMRYLDPRRIRKIREVTQQRDKNNPTISVPKTVNEYYLYSEKDLMGGNKSLISQVASVGVKIGKDSVVHCTSGIPDTENKMILGFLHKAIKPLNSLRALEDATIIYRISRAPERRVFYVDVGNLPKAKAEQFVRDMMVKHKNKLVYDQSTGQVRDDRKFMCYSMDTKIPLLDGRTLELNELISEYESGKTNWAYSCDPKTGKFAPGPISWAGITKRNAEVVRVTLDNGKSVVCTPDHKFPVWDKGFIEAKDLVVGESIIPGYRRKQVMYGTNKEYEQIYKNDTKTWEYTHREVARWKDSVGIREEITHKIEYLNEPKKTIHHKDYNRYNNSPQNLVMMNRDDHLHYHWDMAKFGAGRRINKIEDFTPEWKTNISKSKKGTIAWTKTWKIKSPNGEESIIENLNQFCRENGLNRSNIKYKTSKGYHAEQLHNHKVVSVEYLPDHIDTGCITIDKDETYHSHHTYLLDAGVYTKNTMIEDYWMPRREGGKGTEIVTLPAGQNLGVMEDVMYFEKKLYNSLNVPVERLNPDTAFNIGRSGEITREEVKFAKFVDRMRLKFSTLFLKTLEKQIVLKQIMSPDEWAQVQSEVKFRFLKDNRYAEIKEQELLTGRMNVLTMMAMFVGRYYSNTWVRKNLLKQDDEEIEQIDAEIAQELTMPQYAPPLDAMNPEIDGGPPSQPSSPNGQQMQEQVDFNTPPPFINE